MQWDTGSESIEFFLGQILCFVDLRDIKDDKSYDIGLYAVVHSTKTPVKQNMEDPHILEWHKLPKRQDNGGRELELVNTESFYAPAFVFPDFGGDENNVCFSHSRQFWGQVFLKLGR